MHRIDIAAALSAARHCNTVAVTAAVDDLNFHHPILLGNIVRLKAAVNRAFNTSMDVGVRVEVEEIATGNIIHTNSAYLTFVSIDNETKRPARVPEIIPESDVEKRRYEQALRRRQQRLSEKHGIIHTD